jgi:hypothetical protein
VTDQLERLEDSLTKSLAGFLAGLRSTKKPTTGTDLMTTTETVAAIPEGYTPWNGGDCPKDAQGKPVSVIFRKGRRGEAPNGLHNDCWEHYGEGTDIIAYRIEAAVSQAEPVAWRCFHCSEEFTDREAAALHFGTHEHQEPACMIDIAKFREMEALQLRYVDEDADVHRAMRRMESGHQQALRRAEEDGYAKGLIDAVKYPQGAQPAAVPVESLGRDDIPAFGPLLKWIAMNCDLSDAGNFDGRPTDEAVADAIAWCETLDMPEPTAPPAPVDPLDDILAAFDEAVERELPRVSTVEYNSHEICKHFAGELRARLSRIVSAPSPTTK